ncbi:MAG TPA: winged helix-turn-helix domain-containing protein [Nitrososphaera sp.]
MINRAWRDVVADILETAEGGAIQTTIMYRSFLSYSMLKEYSDLLLQSRLISYDKKTRSYDITEKGKEFLELYKRMNSLVFPPNMKLRKRKK